MENLIIAHPRVLLKELTGGLPAVVVKDFQLRPDRELGHSGDLYPDLLAFDSVGAVYAIECKLAQNPESKERVLEQVLQYGDRLVHLRYDAIDSSTRRKHELAVQKHLRDAHREGVPADPAKSGPYVSIAQRMEQEVAITRRIEDEIGVSSVAWSANDWAAMIDVNLLNKQLRLVIAVDFLHEQLRNTIGKRNARLTSESFDAVWALELTRITQVNEAEGPTTETGLEFLIPQLSVPRSHATGRVLSFAETLSQATGSGRDLYRRLDAWARARELTSEETEVSYQVKGRDGRRLVTLYLTRTVDKVELNLAPLAEAEAQEVRRRLAEMFGQPVAMMYPNIACKSVASRWVRFVAEILEDYARLRGIAHDDAEPSEPYDDRPPAG